jgi:hypothetical protein
VKDTTGEQGIRGVNPYKVELADCRTQGELEEAMNYFWLKICEVYGYDPARMENEQQQLREAAEMRERELRLGAHAKPRSN